MPKTPASVARLSLLALGLGLVACAATPPLPDSGSPWVVSGYLPEKTGEKVYVTLDSGYITAVSPERPKMPENRIIDTSATIFPGFIDLNAELVPGALPFSAIPRAQYQSRAEWIERPSPLGRYERSLPGLGRSADACAAVRWSELRALTGGSTVALGLSPRRLACAEGFGPVNLESGLSEGKFYAEDRPLPAVMMERVFIPHMLPHMEKGASYEEAFRKMLEDQRVIEWTTRFRNETRNLANALRLLLGNDFGFAPDVMSAERYQKKEAAIEKFLLGPPYAMKPAQARRQMEDMRRWIFGAAPADPGEEVGYLKASREETAAFRYLGMDGVLTFDAALRAYIGRFEAAIREPAVRALADPAVKATVLRLGEAQPGNAYGQSEFLLAKRLGYLRTGTIIRGGSAYGPKQFSELKRQEIPLVWTPFTDLLLYGHSLDVRAARAAGLNISLGGGPASAGAKNLLDQLKIAREYLDVNGAREVSNRELVGMLTVNPARALRLEDRMGAVKPGHYANLTLLQCSVAQDPWDCAVRAEPDTVALVVTNGFARYGDPALVQQLSGGSAEALPLVPAPASCDFRRTLRNEDGVRPGVNTAAAIREVMTVAKDDPKAKRARPFAPLYACEDELYQKRFPGFLSRTLPAWRAENVNVRTEKQLPDDWNPLAGAR